MINMKAIEKSFITGNIETLAINKMDLQILKGEFVSILGPSGCGKSTLLNIIGLLDNISGGEYHFNQHSLSSAKESALAKHRKQHIGFIFQSFNLIDELTVEQNIELPLYYHKVPVAERKQRAKEAMERVGISHRAQHLPQKLSGGQQQRVAIARAIVGRPDIILADEPTGNLDSTNSNEVMALLQELNEEGATIVMVTHEPSHIHYGTRVIELLDGKIQRDELIANIEKLEVACA